MEDTAWCVLSIAVRGISLYMNLFETTPIACSDASIYSISVLVACFGLIQH